MEIREIEVEGMDIGQFVSTTKKCAKFLRVIAKAVKEDKGCGRDTDSLTVCAFISLALMDFIEAEHQFREAIMGSINRSREMVESMKIVSDNKNTS